MLTVENIELLACLVSKGYTRRLLILSKTVRSSNEQFDQKVEAIVMVTLRVDKTTNICCEKGKNLSQKQNI